MQTSRQTSEIVIAGRKIGDAHPSFIIAEIGGNFRTLEEGFQEIAQAAASGADAVKIQTYRAETLVSREACFSNIAGGANQYQLFKQYEVSEAWHQELAACAKQHGLIFFSTPSYYDDVDLLVRIGVPVMKTGSDDLTNLPFLRYIASTKLPILLSTGMSDMSEVREAVDTVREAGNDQIVVLHCVSQYPVKNPADLNLRAIQEIKKQFGVPAGFSDHSVGNSASVLAVALGACVVEKHFTLSKSLPTPDSFFSADAPELESLVREIRETEKAMGSFTKQPTEQEKKNRMEIRKSLFARRPIAKGSLLTKENIIIKRPGSGIPPKDLEKALGQKAVQDISEDEQISWGKISR